MCESFVCSVLEFCLQCAGVSFAACWSFVCSVLEFCLQCAGVLFAACRSFVCSVPEFCLQRAGVLFAACNSFACSVHVFFYSFFFVCSVQEMTFLTCYSCLQGIFYFQCYLFVKAVSPVGHRRTANFSPFCYVSVALIRKIAKRTKVLTFD